MKVTQSTHFQFVASERLAGKQHPKHQMSNDTWQCVFIEKLLGTTCTEMQI